MVTNNCESILLVTCLIRYNINIISLENKNRENNNEKNENSNRASVME